MRAMNIIKPAQTEWASPIMIVSRKDGMLHFSVDYQKLNAVTVWHSYPTPYIDKCIELLGDATIFSTLDVKGR